MDCQECLPTGAVVRLIITTISVVITMAIWILMVVGQLLMTIPTQALQAMVVLLSII